MQIEKLKQNDNKAKVPLREILSWIVSAFSILWLIYIWRIYVVTPNDKKIFIVTALIYLPIWVGYTILNNSGKQYKRASQIIAAVAIYPPFLLYFGYYLVDPKSAILKTLELILFTAYFGLFWGLGKRVKEFKIVLFKE